MTDQRDRREAQKLLSHDPAYRDEEKADYIQYTARGLKNPKAPKYEAPAQKPGRGRSR